MFIYTFMEVYQNKIDKAATFSDLGGSELNYFGKWNDFNIQFNFRSNKASSKKAAGNLNQKSSKILIRNIPFEAIKQEVHELFG